MGRIKANRNRTEGGRIFLDLETTDLRPVARAGGAWTGNVMTSALREAGIPSDLAVDPGPEDESEAILEALRAAGHEAAKAPAIPEPEGRPDGAGTRVVLVVGGEWAAHGAAAALRALHEHGRVELVVRDGRGAEGDRVVLLEEDGGADAAEGVHVPRGRPAGFGDMRPMRRIYGGKDFIIPPFLDLRPMREDRSGGAPRGPGAKGARKRQR